MVFGKVLEGFAVLIDPVAEGTDQRGIGRYFHRFLLMGRKALPDIAVDVHVGVHDHLVQALKVVVLQDFLEAEDGVRLGAAPFRRVDDALLERRQDVAATHGNGGNADVIIGLAGNARRRPETVFAEVVHALDGLLEPAKGFRADRLQHQTFDVHAHLYPKFLVELAATAVHVPGNPGDVVDADAGASHRRTEEHGGRVVAGPVMGPGESALDQTLIDSLQGFLHADHGAGRQDLDVDLAVGQCAHVIGKVVEHGDFVSLGRYHRLHANLYRLCNGAPSTENRCREYRCRDCRCDPLRFCHYILLPVGIVGCLII